MLPGTLEASPAEIASADASVGLPGWYIRRMPDSLSCPRCSEPITPLRDGGGHIDSVSIKDGVAINPQHADFEVEYRTCPKCGTTLERTVAPGEQWRVKH